MQFLCPVPLQAGYGAGTAGLEFTSDLQWIAEIFRVFGTPSAKKTDMLRIFGELCGRSHIPERNDVTEVILMVRVSVGKLHNAYLGNFHYGRSF